MYKCIVVDDDISENKLADNDYAIVDKKSRNYFPKKISYIELKPIGKFDEQVLNLSVLKENGLGQVQQQARTPRLLQKIYRFNRR